MTSSTLQCLLLASEEERHLLQNKIRELKSRISKLRAISDKQKAKITAVTIIKQSAENMNNVKNEKIRYKSKCHQGVISVQPKTLPKI